ncbi:MAG: hypothetical protein O3C60_07675 [Planctomycetota bacterium]|nr:hypothetical protein [Planctomycetota bacterium]
MARRENQGLHIGLICMVVVSVLLLGLTYFFWSSTDTQTKKVASLQTQVDSAKAAASKATDENLSLKTLVGHTEDATIEVIQKQYDQDIAAVGSLPAESRSYSKALDALRMTLFETQKQVESLTKSNNELTQKVEEIRKEEKARADTAEKSREAAIVDRDQQVLKFQEERVRITQEKEQLSELLQKQRDEVTQKQQALKQAEAKFAADQQQSQRQVDKLQLQLDEYRKETFDVPSGKITYYSARSKMVHVDLGSDDGLRVHTTFGVFDAGSNNLARAVKKGSIEIQSIEGPHRAQGVVIDEELSNPIIKGDLIYTPLWAPGGRLRFGIAGFVDLNGDGRDDREQLRRLIRTGGGVIDAEDVGPDGRRTGDLSIQTRYLIVGDVPEAGTNKGVVVAAQENRMKNYSAINNQAQKLGIERITVQQVLNYLGYKALSAGEVEAFGEK